MRFVRRRIGTDPDVFRVTVIRRVRRHVLRYIHYDGTRPTRIRNKECLLHCGSEIVYIPDQEIVLHTRSRDSYGVDLLKGIVPDQMSWDLARQNDHRD